MLRLLASHGCNILWECTHSVTSCVAKRRSSSFLLISSACPHFPRHFSTGKPVWKDAIGVQSEEKDKVNLDGWKAVMRSQAAFEEKQAEESDDEDDGDENVADAGVDLKEGSLLEATRALVLMWAQAGKLVPKEMSDEEVEALAKLTTKSSRKKYLKYLAIREHHKLVRKEKQKQKKAEWEAVKKERSVDEEDESEAQLDNRLFLKFWSRSLDKLLAWRSASAMVFGQPLVFDMSYEANMSTREICNTVSQLMEMEGWNRRATDPFHLHFCNLQPGGAYEQELRKRYGAEAWERLFITNTERQHVETFPKDQLVYLTADSPNVLRAFDHSKVYIIGALVDRSINPGLSLANAKRLKLATARLPLDEFLHWEIGGKNLTLDQMIRIMLTIKDTGKWEEALKFVPQRKHDGFYQHQTHKDKRGTDRKAANNDEGPRWSRNPNKRFYKTLEEVGMKMRDRTFGSSSPRENSSSYTKVRSSLKNNLEAMKSSGKRKTWWQDE